MKKEDFEKATALNEEIEMLDGNLKIIEDKSAEFFMGFEHKILGDVTHSELKDLLGDKYEAILKKAEEDIKAELTSARNKRLALFNAL